MKALKKVLLASLALTCLAGPMVQAAPRIINIRDKDFTNIEEPLDAIPATTLNLHPAPRTEDQVREDVTFALQAFYYNSGAPKRADLVQMDDEALYDKLTELSIAALKEPYGDIIQADFSVDFLGKPITLGKELRDSIKVMVDSHQVANKFAIKDLKIDGDTVNASVEVRYIDQYQYEVMLQHAPNFQSEIMPYIEKMRAKYTKDLPESPAASLLINRALKNYAINEVNVDGNHRVPLEYPTRVHEIKLTFVYDAQGRLTLPDETLLAITQIKNREWKKPSDSQSSDQASDSSDSSSESR